MTRHVRRGTNGLIGPNGAGKTTFFNVLSGFVGPSTGPSRRSATTCWRCTAFRRARWGLRRTFQTEQAVAEPVGVRERAARARAHRAGARRPGARTSSTPSSFVGLGPTIAPRRSARSAPPSAGWSRWPGRWSASRGSCCSTSRPPGCPTRRPRRSARSSSRSPNAPGRSSILVDHDMEPGVGDCCATAAVLDFGRVIATGPTAEVLRDEHVIRAYLGTRDASVTERRERDR